MMKKNVTILLILSLFTGSLGEAQTIAEKKSGIAGGSDLSQDMQKFLKQVNKELKEWHLEQKRLYSKVLTLYQNNAPEEEYKVILNKINDIQLNIDILENSWRQMAFDAGAESEYGLWHQPETTLGQLIIDYGSHHYVYLMSPEIADIKLSVDSNLPIPRSSWDQMMDLILTQNGLGFKQLNPYLRQLYRIKDDNSGIRLITNNKSDVEVFPENVRVAFMLTPQPAEVRRVWSFLDKFINPNSTVLQMIGRDILIIAPAGEVLDMLKLYDFVLTNRGDKEYRAVPVSRVDAEEMAKILSSIFDQFIEAPVDQRSQKTPDRLITPDKSKSSKPGDSSDTNGLKVIALAHVAQAVFLVGTKEEIEKAEQIIREVEHQVGVASEKIVFTYMTKHSDPDELAEILEKVYNLMITTGAGLEKKQLEQQAQQLAADQKKIIDTLNAQPPTPPQLMPVKEYAEGYYLNDTYIVNNDMNLPSQPQKDANKGRNNFIVDMKTGAIVMVVEADALGKLKELIKKLDVPKKMVQVEVLLFEKVLTRGNNYGLNLLKLGDCASQTNSTCAVFNDVTATPNNLGVFAFLLSRTNIGKGIPGLDVAYKFLLSQDDVTINASPSVVAINQTTARIEIEEEISVSTGTFVVPTAGGEPSLKTALARARYGIVIEVTPTIHMNESDDEDDDTPDYVTLDTDIKFETILAVTAATQDTPPVIRRKVTNHVRIEDGQTVIIGGLRRKDTEDTRDYIPFLGEIPGVGKLFGTTSLSEKSTDTIIFMTPRIIVDPGEDMERIKRTEMTRRPGDVPEFMCMMSRARNAERDRLFQASMQVVFGLPPGRCYSPYGEYETRSDRERDLEDSCRYHNENGEYDGR